MATPKLPPGRMNQSNRLRIEPVRTARQRLDFHRVRRDLYRNDPSFVLPLRRMEWSCLDPKVHPFYQHAKREVFLAYQGNRPVGRVAAIVDHLHNEYYQDRLGFFGFYEAYPEPEITEHLLNAAADYLRSEGCDQVRGPMSPSMKGEFGVLVEGHESSPRLMMAHTHRYYADLLERFGFEIVKRFFAFRLDIPADPEWAARDARIRAASDRISARFPDLRVELATRENVEQRLVEINTIGNHIRSVGWGFVPMTTDELNYMVSQLRRVIRPEAVVSAYYQDELVGYVVTAPDVNWAIQRTFCLGDRSCLGEPRRAPSQSAQRVHVRQPLLKAKKLLKRRANESPSGLPHHSPLAGLQRMVRLSPSAAFRRGGWNFFRRLGQVGPSALGRGTRPRFPFRPRPL